MGSNWRSAGEVVKYSVGGGWGKEVAQADYQVKVAVIRGADFPDVESGVYHKLPVRWEKPVKADRAALKVGDIVLEISGGTDDRPTGRTILVTSELLDAYECPVIPASFCRLIRPNEDIIDPCYLYFWLQDMYSKGRTWGYQNRSTGLSNFQYKMFAETEQVHVPEMKQQANIATLLWYLNAKRFANNQLNDYLVEMASALYKDFASSASGQIGTLADLVDFRKDAIKAGKRTDLPYMPIDVIPMKSIGVTEFKLNVEAKSSLQLFQRDDIVIGAMRVYFHRVVLAPCEGITRNTCFVLRPKSQIYREYALLTCFQPEAIEYANVRSKGSTMPYAVWENSFETYPILIPEESALEEFSKRLSPVIDTLRDSYKESNRLAELRDALLPKLMSGEIDVSTVDIAS